MVPVFLPGTCWSFRRYSNSRILDGPPTMHSDLLYVVRNSIGITQPTSDQCINIAIGINGMLNNLAAASILSLKSAHLPL